MKSIKKNFTNFLSISILLITVSSILQWSSLPIDNTTLWWAIYAVILYLFWKAKEVIYDYQNEKNIQFIKYYFAWNLICIIRGIFVADNYWEWKNLVGTSMVLLLPLSIYISTNTDIIQKIISFWLKYALPAFFLISLSFTYSDAVGRYLVPISFLLLFFPIIKKEWKIVVLIFALLVFITDLNARSNVIKFAVPILFSITYYFRFFFSTKIFEIARLLLMIAPFILFILGVTGVFNIFKMNDYIEGDYKTTIVELGEIKEGYLTADTRTFLYSEVLSSAIKYDYILFGRTPARGNDSPSFGLYNKEELKTGKMERFANEVSILNVFTWTGFTGVILYLLVFFRASYLAINKSKSFIMKIVGLYVAFRWTFAWVEDFSKFDLSFLFLWIMIGMCYSNAFREMNDVQIKYWIRGIFNLKYRILLNKYNEYLLSKRITSEHFFNKN